jgi:phosphoribosylformylglycinamidine cyclo-ligase
MSKSITYADAGVNIDKANALVDKISDYAKQTPRAGVIGDIGGFGGLFSLNLANLERPVLVSSTDGVGTKLKIACLQQKHNTVGIDLVAMCVNDIIVQGAKPLFFLDYLSMGALEEDIVTAVIEGIAEGCKQAGCALLGGETAEMPGMYQPAEYDLAGFAVGVVDNSKIIDGSEIRVGDILIGIASSGLHSNGYSLARKLCFEILALDIDDYIPELGKTVGAELLTPTKIYARLVQAIIKDLPVRGLAHITGGGIAENILRIIPNGCHVRIDRNSWPVPPIFNYLQQAGNVSEAEMMRTFNNGIGMIAVIPGGAVQDVLQRIAAIGENGFVIGEVLQNKDSHKRVVWS